MYSASETPDLSGIVYVLTNEAMPGIVKVGRTSGDTVQRRVAELSRASGVPLPFRVAIARKVHDAVKVERALHIAFGKDRVNPAREFFSIEPFRLVELINAFPGIDITPEAEAAAEEEIKKEEPQAYEAERSFEQKKRRPPLNFEEMGLPVGTPLVHVDTGEVIEIVGPKKVRMRDDVISLTRAQQLISGAAYQVAPGRYWKAPDGQTILDIYNDTYPHDEDAEI